MIKTLYQLGRIFAPDPEYAHHFTPWQNPYGNRTDGIVLVIDIDAHGKLVTPLESPEGFSRDNLEKYCYRKPDGPNGSNITPTSYLYLARKEADRADGLAKFYDRLKRTLDANPEITDDYLDRKDFWARIQPALDEATRALTREGNILVTFRFNGKYPGETRFRRLLFDAAYDKYKQSKKAQFVGQNHVCAVTHEVADEVWGKIDTLGFTIDAEAFMRGGFVPSEAWRMFPVSREVVPLLEGARALVQATMRYRFHSMDYFIIPRFIGWPDDLIKEATRKLIIARETGDTIDDQGSNVINTENTIHEILRDELLQRTGISFDFFFFQQKQAQLAICAHITDVVPSRLSEIKRTKDSVNTFYKPKLFKKIPASGKKPAFEIQYHLKLGNLKDYFAQIVRSEAIFHPEFFRLLEAIFYRQTIAESVVLRAFMLRMIEAFQNADAEPNAYYDHGYRTLAFWQYFIQLGIFSNYKPSIETMQNATVALELDAFMQQHSNSLLQEPECRAAFLAGCLVDRLLWVQRKQYQNEAFRKYLHNLQVDATKLLKIMQKWEDKVQQYVQAGYISDTQNKEWTALRQEIFPGLDAASTSGRGKGVKFSYAFTMGMVMQRAFTLEAIRKYNESKKGNPAPESI